MGYLQPLNDLAYSQERLNRILSSRRLIFNPYTVTDQRLMHIVEHAGWAGEDDIVQAVVMTFTRVGSIGDGHKVDGIFFRVSFQPDELFIATSTLAGGVTALDTLQRERSIIGKQRITNPRQMEALVGKRVFLSRTIRGKTGFGNYRPAYRMITLRGNAKRDAEAVRTAMCDAKVEMLNRILAHPDCDHYLNCSVDFFPYRPRILRAISIINSWRTMMPPAE